MENKSVELKDLVGKHKLSGVDFGTQRIHEGEYYYETDAETMLFILDGVTYKASEDPEDGYRSSCDAIEIVEEKVSNKFPPQKVIAKMKERDADGMQHEHDTLQLIDVVTKKVVLEVGTDAVNDYYPMCIMYFSPENMAINQDKRLPKSIKGKI